VIIPNHTFVEPEQAAAEEASDGSGSAHTQEQHKEPEPVRHRSPWVRRSYRDPGSWQSIRLSSHSPISSGASGL
jgi:hypothetical protein